MHIHLVGRNPARWPVVRAILSTADMRVETASLYGAELHDAIRECGCAFVVDVPSLAPNELQLLFSQIAGASGVVLTDRTSPELEAVLAKGDWKLLAAHADASAICDALQSLGGRDECAADDVVAVGDVQVDLEHQRVCKNDRPVRLTAKEYCLLELLVRHRGEVVPRPQIYEHLYHEIDDAFANVLDVYVSNLRRKLGRTLITTRRGEGYLVAQ